jgi:tetratricopeptide (TPR) repeat protein
LYDPDDFPWFNTIAGSLLCVLVAVYGIATFARNPVWTSDLTLWEDAITKSKRAFRCYQSLAFALYEQNPTKNVDRMISTAEGALPIVDPLPNHLNSSRLYLHLGIYYSIKGDIVGRQPDGSHVVTDESRKWYEKAALILKRGVEIDRSFNEVNTAKEKRRGTPPELVNDAGLSPVYGTLGMAHFQLGQLEEAFLACQYQRHLDPQDADAYLKIATIRHRQGRLDDAIVSVVQAILIEKNQPRMWQSLAELYAMYPNGQGQGAIVVENGTPKLHLGHPVARDHLMLAYRDFVRIFRRAHRWQAAEDARKAAVEMYKMPAVVFEDVFKEPVNVVTPDGILFDQFTAVPATKPTTNP